MKNKGVYSDLLRQFRDNGHKVYVVSPRQKRIAKPTEYTNENGIHFLRVRIGNITKTNVIKKGVSTLMLESVFLKAIKKYIHNVEFDLVLYSTPPITFEKIIRYVKKRDNAKTYLLLKDIFPQNAVDLNMFGKNNPIYWYFRNKEKKLYRISDYIGCMSQANVDFILKNNPGIPPSIVEVCPNSIEPLAVEKNEKKIAKIKEKYNIPTGKTVFIYGGNLGKPQGIEFLIDCLKATENNEQAYFIIAGSGTEFSKLRAFFDSKKPKNAQLFAHLPREEYEMLANSCDVGLIFLDKRFTIPNFPSRILSYMQASIPVLAATDVNTDVGKVIKDGNFGFWCESSYVSEFNQKVQVLCDPIVRNEMGANARNYLENNYTARHSYEIIMNHFK